MEHLHEHYGRDIIVHHMVVSHSDNDHAAGLIEVFKNFHVDNLWMNRPWLYAHEVIDHFHGNWSVEGWIRHVRETHEYLVELEDLARGRGMEPQEIFQGAQIGPFHVLAPSRKRYVSLIPDLGKTPPPYKSELGTPLHLREGEQRSQEGDAANRDAGCKPSRNVRVERNKRGAVRVYENHKVLLTADAGPEALAEAAIYARTCGMLSAPNLIQIPQDRFSSSAPCYSRSRR